MFYTDASVVFWSNFWKWVILLGSIAFFLLMLYTIVVGASDIRRLFSTLRKRQNERPPQEQH